MIEAYILESPYCLQRVSNISQASWQQTKWRWSLRLEAVIGPVEGAFIF